MKESMEIERAHAKRERAESEKQRAQSREFVREILFKERMLIDNLAKVDVNTQDNSMEKTLPQNAMSLVDKKITEENYESESNVNGSKMSISNMSPQKYADKRSNFIDDMIINSRENTDNEAHKSPRPSLTMPANPESPDKYCYSTPVPYKQVQCGESTQSKQKQGQQTSTT